MTQRSLQAVGAGSAYRVAAKAESRGTRVSPTPSTTTVSFMTGGTVAAGSIYPATWHFGGRH